MSKEKAARAVCCTCTADNEEHGKQHLAPIHYPNIRFYVSIFHGLIYPPGGSF
jgi:hypothetical protein